MCRGKGRGAGRCRIWGAEKAASCSALTKVVEEARLLNVHTKVGSVANPFSGAEGKARGAGRKAGERRWGVGARDKRCKGV